MGNRRMMSKTITASQRFLTLPIEAQVLYFHMLQHTDDDGITEAFPHLRLLSLGEDILDLLEKSRFIRKLNNELVYYVVDFREQNSIDGRRYHPSIYHNLLAETECSSSNTNSEKSCNLHSNDVANINKDNKIQNKSKKKQDDTSETRFKIKFSNAK